MSFRVGDRVRIVRSNRPERVGTITTIMEASTLSHDAGKWTGILSPGDPVYRLNLAPGPGYTRVVYPPNYLEHAGPWDEGRSSREHDAVVIHCDCGAVIQPGRALGVLASLGDDDIRMLLTKTEPGLKIIAALKDDEWAKALLANIANAESFLPEGDK